ncbi:unnamed protein product [Meganyctiphanes norvegica]|uniref:Gag protein n=1 Tax=Meganyctiphanes norvegica TaxID=48144 RepID=A0AAV2SWE7_MEGNR
MSRKLDDAAAQKLADRLDKMSSSAATDVENSKIMYDAREHTETAVMGGMLKRLESWHERLEKIEKELIGYKGTSVDVSAVIYLSEDTQMDLVEQKVILELYIQGITAAAVKGVTNNSTKIVKTSPSHFPEFDGESDYEIWGSNWKCLADNSGLSETGLLIKLRESIVGRAKNYIGESGMANLSYAQVWDKLKERYAVPWARTQQATRKYFGIQPPLDDRQSIIDYIDAVRDAIDTVELVGITPESLLLNMALDNLPSRVRLPLVEKLEVTNEDFKFTKNLFEKQFSRTMNLLEDNKKSSTASMYTSQVGSTNFGSTAKEGAYHDSSNKASTPTNQGSSDSQTGNSPQGGSHHLGGRGEVVVEGVGGHPNTIEISLLAHYAIL